MSDRLYKYLRPMDGIKQEIIELVDKNMIKILTLKLEGKKIDGSLSGYHKAYNDGLDDAIQLLKEAIK